MKSAADCLGTEESAMMGRSASPAGVAMFQKNADDFKKDAGEQQYESR